MSKRSRQSLGRQLDALIVGARELASPPSLEEREHGEGRGNQEVGGNKEGANQQEKGLIKSGLVEIEVTHLTPGRYQPRRQIAEAELQSLAESIRSAGILQPIVVRALEKGQYEIIAGERRWRAAQLAGLKKVPVIIKVINDEQAMAFALIENIQREDLTPLEEAYALERLSREFGLTHIQVADLVGKSRATVTNFLRLLSLNEEVKALLEKGSLEMGHAKALLGLPSDKQFACAKRVVEKELSVRETEKLVALSLKPLTSEARLPAAVDPNIHHLEQSLSERLGAHLEIMHEPRQGKGKIVIHYHSLDALDGILAHIH